ncbi:Arc family DNA-binding protein [Mesorhizobium sp. M0058]|uniref:Arc family DNA-binding protein n=1 Tax=Mesorhizobium sp. M0058 TaxID=2956865 RepID=UPI0033361DE7
MAREDPQINIRLPANLKERLEERAERNNRSTTAEIVARLEQSFLGPKHPPSITIRLEALPFGTPAIDVSIGTFFSDLSKTLKESVESIRAAERVEGLAERERAANSLEPAQDAGIDDARIIVSVAAENTERRRLKRLAKLERDAAAAKAAQDDESGE